MALSALGTVSRGVGSVVVYTGSAVYKAASRVFTGGRSLWSHMSLRARISLVIAIPVVIAVVLYIKKKWSGNPLGGGGGLPLGALPPEERLRAERERRLAAIEARRVAAEAAEAERRRLAALPAVPPVVVEAPPPPPAPRVRPEHARRAAEAAERRLAALPPPLAGPLVERGGELAPPALGAPLAIPAGAAPVVDVPVPGVAADPAPMEVAPVLVEAPPPVALPLPEEVALVPAGPVLADPAPGDAPPPVALPVPEEVALVPAGPAPALVEAPPAEAAPDPRVALAVVASLTAAVYASVIPAIVAYASVIPAVVAVAASQAARLAGEEVTEALARNNALLEAADRSAILDDVRIHSNMAAALSEDAKNRQLQKYFSISRIIQQNSSILELDSRAFKIANYAKHVISVQFGRMLVAHFLSRSCSLASLGSQDDLDLARPMQMIESTLRNARRTVAEAREMIGWSDQEIVRLSNLPDISDLERMLEQEVGHARQVLQVRLPEKIAHARGIED